MKKFFSEFGAFIRRGNVIDMAVGVIIGGAFNKIITSIANDMLMPLISLLLGKTDFEDMFVVLKGDSTVQTLAAAKEAGATVLAYGNIIQLVINFLLTALCLFIVIKILNRVHDMGEKIRKQKEIAEKEEPKEPVLTTTETLLTEIKALLEKQGK